VQVKPMKPVLKAPGTKRPKLKYEKTLSNVAFKFKLRRYIEAVTNFDMNNYRQELAALDQIGKEELVLSLRRQSKGFVKAGSEPRLDVICSIHHSTPCGSAQPFRATVPSNRSAQPFRATVPRNCYAQSFRAIVPRNRFAQLIRAIVPRNRSAQPFRTTVPRNRSVHRRRFASLSRV